MQVNLTSTSTLLALTRMDMGNMDQGNRVMNKVGLRFELSGPLWIYEAMWTVEKLGGAKTNLELNCNHSCVVFIWLPSYQTQTNEAT